MKRTPLRRVTPIKRRSVKKQKADATRKGLRQEFLDARPACERCGGVATDVHEIIRRSQAKDAATRPELFVGLCRRCHTWATVEPVEAHECGYVLWSYEDDPASLKAAAMLRADNRG